MKTIKIKNRKKSAVMNQTAKILALYIIATNGCKNNNKIVSDVK